MGFRQMRASLPYDVLGHAITVVTRYSLGKELQIDLFMYDKGRTRSLFSFRLAKPEGMSFCRAKNGTTQIPPKNSVAKVLGLYRMSWVMCI